MKFAHLSDCHVGGWREPRMNDFSLKAFLKATDICVEKGVDFVLISGDLFNTSLPAIDKLKAVVIKLVELRKKEIPVYVIAGSHDYSPSGKTFLDVIEHAGLIVNVTKGSVENGRLKLKFTIDKKTGAKITGILGKRGMLDKKFYEDLDRESLEKEAGYKIFMFHTMVDEFKTKEFEKIESIPISFFPKNFDYYAGGHIHKVGTIKKDGYGIMTYPGPLFPNNFRELEELERGGFYIVENGRIEWQPVQLVNVFGIKVDCNYKTPKQISEEVLSIAKGKQFFNTVVLIRLFGKLSEGKISDIDFREIFSELYNKGAYFVMKNTAALETKEFGAVKISGTTEEIEERLIDEHLGQIPMKNERAVVVQLMKSLNSEKHDGERIADFEKRLSEDVLKLLEIEEALDEKVN